MGLEGQASLGLAPYIYIFLSAACKLSAFEIVFFFSINDACLPHRTAVLIAFTINPTGT